MAEEVIAQDKAKRPGLLRRIGWWIWVILLTALLVLGLVFAAPWKVITLIAIFLAAATILPRIYRKWFWLAVGLAIVSAVVWVFLPDDNEGWRPYQFDKELTQLQAKYAVPDNENAAILYNQILADWKQKDTNEPNLPNNWYHLALNGPWLRKDHPEILSYIKYHQDGITLILKATSFQKCSFPFAASYIDFDYTKHRQAMREGARLLVASGNNDITEGNTNEGIEKYIAAIRLGQHASQQPDSIDVMTGFACEAVGLGGIKYFVVLGDANEFYLTSHFIT